jgi:hypothetical protein
MICKITNKIFFNYQNSINLVKVHKDSKLIYFNQVYHNNLLFHNLFHHKFSNHKISINHNPLNKLILFLHKIKVHNKINLLFLMMDHNLKVIRILKIYKIIKNM